MDIGWASDAGGFGRQRGRAFHLQKSLEQRRKESGGAGSQLTAQGMGQLLSHARALISHQGEEGLLSKGCTG